MSDAIGAMRRRVRLLRRVRIADEIGGAAIAFADAGEVWAEIEAHSAEEVAIHDANAALAAFRVTIYRRDDVRAGWRVAWGARTLRIAAIRDDGAPRIDLMCEEERT